MEHNDIATEKEQLLQEILLKHPLCEECVQRLFKGLQKNKSIRSKDAKGTKKPGKTKGTAHEECWLCQDLLKEISHFTQLIIDVLQNYEFDTFLVGVRVDEDILSREQDLFMKLGLDKAEDIKTILKRNIGMALEARLGKAVDFDKPTIMLILDTMFDVVDLQIQPLFVYGKYNKFTRDLPQTKWFCKICQGHGCRVCKYTGTLYDSSVEERISSHLIKETDGENDFFHGSGREDIDVRMLGEGRPFVIEVTNPKKRTLDFERLQVHINTQEKGIIQVHHLRLSTHEEVIRLKSAAYPKVYQAIMTSQKAINKEKLIKAALSLRGKSIHQFTPARVAHRRAHLVREKKIFNCTVDAVEGNVAHLTIEAESGTYIKELISGDDGRTTPSISELMKQPCTIVALDVIEIKGE
jgi:tRNA pseudouridine synthase 10